MPLRVRCVCAVRPRLEKGGRVKGLRVERSSAGDEKHAAVPACHQQTRRRGASFDSARSRLAKGWDGAVSLSLSLCQT